MLGKSWTSGISDLKYNLCIKCGKMIPKELDRCWECSDCQVESIIEHHPTMSVINQVIDILERREQENAVKK